MPSRPLAALLVVAALLACRDGPTASAPPDQEPSASASLQDPLVHALLDGLGDRALAARLRAEPDRPFAMPSPAAGDAAAEDAVAVAALALLLRPPAASADPPGTEPDGALTGRSP